MLPPIIDVRVLSSVVLTLSVIAVAVAAPDDSNVAMPHYSYPAIFSFNFSQEVKPTINTM